MRIIYRLSGIINLSRCKSVVFRSCARYAVRKIGAQIARKNASKTALFVHYFRRKPCVFSKLGDKYSDPPPFFAHELDERHTKSG